MYVWNTQTYIKLILNEKILIVFYKIEVKELPSIFFMIFPIVGKGSITFLFEILKNNLKICVDILVLSSCQFTTDLVYNH